MLKKHFSSRSFRIILLLFFFFSLLCTQVPLFNYLGLESSALTAVLGAFLSGMLLVMRWNSAQKESPFFLDRFAMESLFISFLLHSVPLTVLLTNSLFVKNCSLSQGLLLFALIPIPAMIFSNVLALLLSVTLPRWRKIAFTTAYLLVLFHIVVVTFVSPQIFAFNPIAGFFPGITYDESLKIESRLLIYRIGTLAAAGMLFIVAKIVFRRKEKQRGEETSLPVRVGELMGGAFLVILVSWLFFFSNELGLSSSRSFIQEKLGGRYETDHFVIVYPRDELDDRQIKRVAQLHEFYFAHISRVLQIMPERKVQSFLYRSAEQKGRLVGAAGTDIAKPWLWQLHINLGNVERSLKHELVHVMAADFGFPLLRISFNSGLIEGLAVAVEQVDYDETIHRLAGQINALGHAPDVQSLFTVSGFFKAHGGTSYILAGSFCRYLIEQYGVRRFKSLYRTGNFRTLYNKDLDDLVEEWRLSIRHPPPPTEDLFKAAYLFKRPSIFGKECARVIANINAETRSFLRGKKFGEALVSSQRSLGLTKSSEAVNQHAAALLRLGKNEEVVRFCREQLADSLFAHTVLPLHLTVGDALWSLGRIEEARTEYRKLYGFHLGISWDEASAVRTAALNDPRRASVLRGYFTSDMSDSEQVDFLKSSLRSIPLDPLCSYLLGRELVSSRRFSEGLGVLHTIRVMNAPILEFLRFRRIGFSYFELGNYEKAKAFFWESLNFTLKQSHQIEVSEWVERCEWMEENAGK